jgi:hypothetical protein
MLEVSGGGAKMHTEAVKADFTALYRASELCLRTEKAAAEIVDTAKANCEPLQLKSEYAASSGRQIVQVTWKFFLVYWYARDVALHVVGLADDVDMFSGLLALRYFTCAIYYLWPGESF